MNIVAYIITYNEEKMIRHTLNHYTSFCSRVHIFDNRSTDRTRAIASEYPNVTIHDFDTGGKFNDRHHLEIKNSCWKDSTADYVITCDCDEFLYAENILDQLSTLKKQGVTLPTIAGYNMYCEYFPADYSKPIFSQVTTGVRALHFDKQIIFSPRLKEINFSPGAHHCHPVGKLIRNNTRPFKLLHYKYLSYDGVRYKHEHYALRMSDYNKKNNFGAEYSNGSLDGNFEMIKKASQPVIPLQVAPQSAPNP